MQFSTTTLLALVSLVSAAPRIGQFAKRDFTSPDLTSPDHQTCDANTPLSCSSGASTDGCCVEATNGLLMSTQFWDYNPATGPSDKFTLHGLWCDTCDGDYNTNCNPDWNVSGVEEVLKNANQTELLDQMNQVWKNFDGADSELWEHEFNKHGTCMYTLNPDCYNADADKNQYLVDFYTTAMDMWNELPTYDWLVAAGIKPDASATHTVDEIQKVLAGKLGVDSVELGCDDSNALQEVYYYFNLQGSVAAGTFNPVNAMSKGTCKDGLKWIPKS